MPCVYKGKDTDRAISFFEEELIRVITKINFLNITIRVITISLIFRELYASLKNIQKEILGTKLQSNL